MFSFIFNAIKEMLFFTGSYSNTIFPDHLSLEEETKAIDGLMNKDENARNLLIEHNLRLVAHLVKKYENESVSQDDLISIGTIGLIKGIDSYNPNKNIKITTYIAKCVENEILMFFRANKKYNNDISLNSSIGLDKDGDEVSLLDVIPSLDDDLNTMIFNKINKEDLLRYLDVLSKRERYIIINRYGLFNSDEYTQKEIAKKMHISRSYVSRIEKRALTKLYKEFYKKDNKKRG